MIQLLLVLGILVLTPVVASSDGHSTSDPSISTRIAGGNDASESYPFFILWGGCGATLIHNDIALTAAHCSKKPHAQVGAHKRGGESGWTNVDRVIRHPDYDPETFDYDVAVFRMGGWFEQSTVKLNEIESEPTPGTSLTMLGFGGEASALQEAKVNYITPSVCAEEWREYGYTIDSTSMICAGDTDADVCTGDSGGPLLEGKRQVGIVSNGASICNSGLPSIYSRVSAASEWIAEQVCELSQHPPSDCQRDGPGKLETRIRVDIRFDSYPEDIWWTISRVSSQATVAKTVPGNINTENGLVSKFVDLKDGEYLFTINDQYGDGLGNVGGDYHVYTVDEKGFQIELLASGGGDFGSVEFQIFTISSFDVDDDANSATAPPSAPSKKKTSKPKQSLTIAPSMSSTTSPQPVEPSPTTPAPELSPINKPQPTTQATPQPAEMPETDEPTKATKKNQGPKGSGRELRYGLDGRNIERRALQEEEDDEPTPESTNEPENTPESTLEPSAVTISPAPTSPLEQPPSSSPMATLEPSISTRPSLSPSISTMPSMKPSISTMPSMIPSDVPSDVPSSPPTSSPAPSISRTSSPVEVPPSALPTASSPTQSPSSAQVPTQTPTTSPSTTPTEQPTVAETGIETPSVAPSNTLAPSDTPTAVVPATSSPTFAPTEAPSSSPPSASPTISPEPTQGSSEPLTSTPSDFPTEAPSISAQPTTEPPTTSEPTFSPTEAPSSSPPSVSPTISPEPTEGSSESPTSTPTDFPTDAPSISAQPTTESPTTSEPPASIETPFPTIAPSTASVQPSTSTAPSATPTAPSLDPVPSASPTIALIRYMAQVNVSISSNPEAISWRILDDITGDQVFGYRPGSYEATGFFTQLIILTTGSYEFQLTRSTVEAEAVSAFGILNFTTGLTDRIGLVDFVGMDSSTTVTSTFALP